MKKIVFLVLMIVFLTGCQNSNPKNVVKEYLEEYRNYTDNVEENLNGFIDKYGLSKEEKENYLLLMKKQFVNLKYKIKDVIYDGYKADVIVEITVLDYKNLKNINSNFDFKELFKQTKNIKYTLVFKTKYENNEWILEEPDEDTLLKIKGLN